MTKKYIFEVYVEAYKNLVILADTEGEARKKAREKFKKNPGHVEAEIHQRVSNY